MYKQAVILLLMLFTASVSAALPARYMQTIENAAVWAQIGDKMVTVGNIRAGQIIAVEPTAASYYVFNFGLGKGFIDKGHLEPVQGRQKVEDGLGDLNKPLSNQNLVTGKIRRSITRRVWAVRHLEYWRTICATRFCIN